MPTKRKTQDLSPPLEVDSDQGVESEREEEEQEEQEEQEESSTLSFKKQKTEAKKKKKAKEGPFVLDSGSDEEIHRLQEKAKLAAMELEIRLLKQEQGLKKQSHIKKEIVPEKKLQKKSRKKTQIVVLSGSESNGEEKKGEIRKKEKIKEEKGSKVKLVKKIDPNLPYSLSYNCRTGMVWIYDMPTLPAIRDFHLCVGCRGTGYINFIIFLNFFRGCKIYQKSHGKDKEWWKALFHSQYKNNLTFLAQRRGVRSLGLDFILILFSPLALPHLKVIGNKPFTWMKIKGMMFPLLKLSKRLCKISHQVRIFPLFF
jgi:hypothetical protein